MKKIFLSLSFLFCFQGVFAQQDAMLSHYMFSGLLLNPAYGGTHPYFSASLLYRTQWTGFSGAPKTQLLTADGPLAQDKMGVGLIIAHDKIGVTDQTDFYGSYSYKVKIGSGKLALGLRAGVTDYRAKLTTLTYWDLDDEVLVADIQSALVPKFGFGAYYYAEKYYAGISIPTLIAYQKDYKFSVDVEKASVMRRHYYLNGGYVLNLSETLNLIPSLLLKYNPSAPMQADINVSVMYKGMAWMGTSVRTGDAVVFMAGYQTSEHIRFGYSYDYTTSRIQKYSNGTHEFMIAYDFGGEKIKSTTPRFF